MVSWKEIYSNPEFELGFLFSIDGSMNAYKSLSLSPMNDQGLHYYMCFRCIFLKRCKLFVVVAVDTIVHMSQNQK